MNTSSQQRMNAEDIFKRSPHNPLITHFDVPGGAAAAFNPGAIQYKDQVLLLLRVEDRKGFSSIHAARSDDGVTRWDIDPEPLLAYGGDDLPYETMGCEDARVTYIEEDERYYITYVAYSSLGPSVGLAFTEDFKSVERIGLIYGPTNKDSVLFPTKIDGFYHVLHRPVSGEKEHIWSARSPDLIHWGEPHCILPERQGPYWDAVKVGAGPPPIYTDQGWLVLYHGVKAAGHKHIYRTGLALLDLQRPNKVLARSKGWVFGPEADYETRGIYPDVVFPCGTIQRDGELWIYYGAADTCVCLAVARMDDLLSALLPQGNDN